MPLHQATGGARPGGGGGALSDGGFSLALPHAKNSGNDKTSHLFVFEGEGASLLFFFKMLFFLVLQGLSLTQ